MYNYNDLNKYNDDIVHDMWVDYDYNTNTGELNFIAVDTEEYYDSFDNE